MFDECAARSQRFHDTSGEVRTAELGFPPVVDEVPLLPEECDGPRIHA
jgi:hypothetical protein